MRFALEFCQYGSLIAHGHIDRIGQRNRRFFTRIVAATKYRHTQQILLRNTSAGKNFCLHSMVGMVEGELYFV